MVRIGELNISFANKRFPSEKKCIFSFLAADQTSAMQEQMSGAAGSMPQDPKAAFKAEWEALEITEYQNVLQNIDSQIYSAISNSL